MRLILFLMLLSLSIVYAIRRGGEPERAVAIILIFMTISDPFVHAITPLTYIELDPGHFIIDLGGWSACLVVALRAQRVWPLWITSLQTISLIAHVTRLVDYSVHPTAYAIMQVASSYPLLMILIIGTRNHQQRLLQNGSDPSWRSS